MSHCYNAVMRGKRIEFMPGERCGRLVVVSANERRSSGMTWRCLCDCGTETIARATDLRSGHTSSCGCLVTDTTTARNVKHGQASRGAMSGAYVSYALMRNRCLKGFV